MKKLLFIAVIAFLFSNIANAQVATSEKGISFGAKAGVNLASISGIDESNGESIKGRTSFHIGALAEYSFSEKFSVQLEILYSGLGYKYEYNYDFTNNTNSPALRGDGGFFNSGEGTIKLDYISVPVLAKYYIIPGLSVEAGPQVSFLLSAKDDYTETYFDGDENVTESGKEDIKDSVKGVDFGAAVGASYQLDLGLFFSARYVFGLTQVNEFGSPSNKNNVFQLSAGYKFN